MSLRELEAIQDEPLHANVGATAVIAPLSPVNKSGKEAGGTLNYKVLGRVLAAGLCMFMLLKDGPWGGTTQRVNSHHLGLTAAIVCGIISGVAIKVVELVRKHGLKISTAKENICYLMVLLNIFALCTVVPGGQSFIAYFIVYHGLIQAKVETHKHLVLALGVYSLWIYLTVKEFLSVDWWFVTVTVAIATLWSILNMVLHMDKTFVNKFRIHIIVLMACFVTFNYDRFVAPALVMVVQIFAYTTVKMIAKTQTWYITSK